MNNNQDELDQFAASRGFKSGDWSYRIQVPGMFGVYEFLNHSGGLQIQFDVRHCDRTNEFKIVKYREGFWVGPGYVEAQWNHWIEIGTTK